jgi:pyridoxamine 5'-phosphate oxidase
MNPDTEKSPLRTLAAWIEEARALGVKDPDAMALATATPAGAPSVRVVLCRAIDDDGIRFFTNYESRKGRELGANAHAAAAFHWRELEKQVRVEGEVTRSSAAVSDAYFASRARGSQLAARVSPQSQPIESLAALLAAHAALDRELAGRAVERPAHWGGFDLRATAVELWHSGASRLHDCVRYERHGAGWVATRRGP